MSRVTFLVVLVLGIAGSVAAGPNDNWIIYLRAADSSAGNYLNSYEIYGTKTGATDAPAEATNDTINGTGSGKVAVLACYDLGAGANGNGYYKDLRTPYDPVSHPLPAWNLRMWVQSNWKSGDVYLTGWNQTGSYALNGSVELALKIISDPTGSYAPGTVLHTFGAGSHGTSSLPEFTAIFHNTADIKGGGSYVDMQLVPLSQGIESPEPAGMLSLLTLVSGLSGYVLVRRRH